MHGLRTLDRLESKHNRIEMPGPQPLLACKQLVGFSVVALPAASLSGPWPSPPGTE
jgi:hypothetical protein